MNLEVVAHVSGDPLLKGRITSSARVRAVASNQTINISLSLSLARALCICRPHELLFLNWNCIDGKLEAAV